ncbi:beta-ketoacyl-[acyl-carrier-protein] synthase family protein [Planctomycetes bacterium K23_9]|uniref:3-oxoacyl-[acyl-carrier-protein] synthase 2 n=1 Tax=Stieleria marina TaxID=1930275 RepID=A0A517P133_9BACT|nr:3-oxoacyl-[acyl-carrier-protein] synthase 2 [Planctomycetes bacterium K23_9]
MPSSRAVITGLGIVSAIGIGCDEYFDALLNGQSGVRSLAERTDEGAKPSDEPADLASAHAGLWIGAPIIDFDPKQYVRPRKALKVMCREIQTAFAASQLAIEKAGLESSLPASADSPITPSRVGTVFGGEMYFGPPEDMVEPIQECIESDGQIKVGKFGAAARRGVMPLWMLKYLPNMPACHIGISVNAHGPNNSLILGDVSGPAALIEAISYLNRDLCDVVITGATGTLINSTRMNYRNDLPLPKVADPIANSSRPHSLDSQGVVGGEAATGMVVETAEHASQRGAAVVAQIVACVSRFSPAEVMSHGDRQSSQNGSVGRGSAAAIRLAIDAAFKQAGISAEQIGLIVSHGSGDAELDAAERTALATDLQSVPMIAPMASVGHTGAASGAIGIATAAMVIQRQLIPPPLSADGANDVNLQSKATALEKEFVLCLAHTPEGNATAVILNAPSL